MGSIIKMNAILKLTTEAGMPKKLKIGARHYFQLKGERIFQFHPVWVTLVHEIDGKWKFVGQAHVMKQTIDAELHLTTGEFVITRIFPNEVAKLISIYEAPDNESYFHSSSIEEAIEYLGESRTSPTVGQFRKVYPDE